ncbi:N-alpha-acetyltransferase 50 [Pyrus x bretschneideri]|nr:N-alpha-acetyltransferase 50 [Pyrus x bretschneideri]
MSVQYSKPSPFLSLPRLSLCSSSLSSKTLRGEMGAGREVQSSLDGLRDKNVMQLKKLNTALFPVRYNDKYYADALASGDFTKLAYFSDICVGAIACRLEKKENGAVRVYIMTLGVLAPYRGLGIGKKLLNHSLDLCAKQNISEIYLHVQTNNEDAINFYKKFGFEITETIQNYYTNITPPDCYVLTKYITQTKK